MDMYEAMNKANVKICPRCGKEYEGYPALSRKDNKTKICSQCGTMEAISDFINYLKGDK